MDKENISNRVYDKDLIMQRVEEFRSKNYKPQDLTIYFDLDNTLALFSIYGTEDQVVKIMYSKGFYKELPIFTEAPYVLENLMRIGFRVKILSSCIDSPFCRPEKIEWVNYHLPFIKKRDIILIENGKTKADYIKDPTKSILVDDYFTNLMAMYEAGGIAIKKSYSGKDRPVLQISNLIDIFSVLYDLNCLNK